MASYKTLQQLIMITVPGEVKLIQDGKQNINRRDDIYKV